MKHLLRRVRDKSLTQSGDAIPCNNPPSDSRYHPVVLQNAETCANVKNGSVRCREIYIYK